MQPTSIDNELFITDNIIFGAAELPARIAVTGIYWITPGSGRIYHRQEAIEYAMKLDKIIRFNVARTSKRPVLR
jgi:hypothetical protein